MDWICVCGSEPSGSIKCEEFLDQLRTCSDPWTQSVSIACTDVLLPSTKHSAIDSSVIQNTGEETIVAYFTALSLHFLEDPRKTKKPPTSKWSMSLPKFEVGASKLQLRTAAFVQTCLARRSVEISQYCNSSKEAKTVNHIHVYIILLLATRFGFC